MVLEEEGLGWSASDSGRFESAALWLPEPLGFFVFHSEGQSALGVELVGSRFDSES